MKARDVWAVRTKSNTIHDMTIKKSEGLERRQPLAPSTPSGI
jgi:hypothetical protein